jgi:stage II sporulation protein D
MSGASWATAALVLLHLTSVGALPKEVPAAQVAGYATTQPIRVLIARGATSLVIRTGAPSVIEEADTEARLASIAAGEKLTVTRAGQEVVIRGTEARASGARLLLRPEGDGPPARVTAKGGWGARGSYPGTLEFRINGGISVVEQVDLESYTAGVVAAEVPADFPLEAMKAQAIAAPTCAVRFTVTPTTASHRWSRGPPARRPRRRGMWWSITDC